MPAITLKKGWNEKYLIHNGGDLKRISVHLKSVRFLIECRCMSACALKKKTSCTGDAYTVAYTVDSLYLEYLSVSTNVSVPLWTMI